MDYQWQYPIYLIAHGGGYASIVDPGDESESPRQFLAIHTSEPLSLAFMQRFGIVGQPRKLNNDREFRWLLKSLKFPVTEVAFDPDPVEMNLNAAWVASVESIAEQHLHVDNSPWNYPVYIVDHGTGYASISGEDEAGNSMQLLNLFTTMEGAQGYLEHAQQKGEILCLPDVEQAREVVLSLKDQISAVAIDPEMVAGGGHSQYCIAVEPLLDKYLIREN
ncbi:MAG: hypothetical protein WDZ51_19765 [Pirellulaceae bacterium]